jgi:hypothetical protein
MRGSPLHSRPACISKSGTQLYQARPLGSAQSAARPHHSGGLSRDVPDLLPGHIVHADGPLRRRQHAQLLTLARTADGRGSPAAQVSGAAQHRTVARATAGCVLQSPCASTSSYGLSGSLTTMTISCLLATPS